jgi:hypothetical protein
MAYLTRSPIIFKTSIGNIDAQYLNVIERQNRLDKIVGAADVASASISWKSLFLNKFVIYAGKEFDITEFKNNPDKYFNDNKDAFEKTAIEVDKFIDKKFVLQSELGKAPKQRIKKP